MNAWLLLDDGLSGAEVVRVLFVDQRTVPWVFASSCIRGFVANV
ncbi:MAG: hypothetical protein V3U75_13270 [Methylococcaceae bacterium]